jgi:segregation and condensation protein A
MTDTTFQPDLDFQAASNAAEDGDALIVDIDGYEGPLHVLLALARTQKVDLLQLSVTRLADQYLKFVKQARRLRFSLAADYLVMAAWLAYLKSRLLLPRGERPKAEEPPPEEIAAQLAFRLAKLDAMRRAVEALRERPQLKRDVFTRGDPEAVKILSSNRIEGDLYQLMSAYIGQRRKEADRSYRPYIPVAYGLEDARDRLRGMVHEFTVWTAMGGVAPEARDPDGPSRSSYVASTLAASLELVKEGVIEARQLEAFTEVFLRKRKDPPPGEGGLA